MKLLSCVAVLVGSLLATQNAQAIDLWRNQKRYDIDIPPPSGIPFARQGVDRLFTIAGLGNLPDISGTLRLIQDEMTECGTLIEGRKRNYLRQGYTQVYENLILPRQCVISLGSREHDNMMSSYYYWLEMCRCYAAVHFRYKAVSGGYFEASRDHVLGPLETAARASTSKGRLDGSAALDADWMAAIRILRDRGFSPRMALTIQTSFFGYSHANGISDPRMPRRAGVDYIAHIWGAKKKSGTRWAFEETGNDETIGQPDLAFDMENGFDFWGKSVKPQDVARSISDCYKKVDYARKCKMTYHSRMGCMMTEKWKRFCRKTVTDKDFRQYGDLCLWTPKGDLPMAPMTTAAEKTVTLPSAEKAKSQAMIVKLRKAPACDDGMLKAYVGKY
ncbi:hypothetical protein ABK249_28245 [Neorhizobium sp. Rsf11]|uniref:Uncharacterized protein n=2 Tax=Neorhizobium TaxID=1525371 RepID=A0ABV0MA95_9HYPH|nr:hypothetical protein [Neorhizobium petrolearium]MCC2613909.1 hypothetical protein [Neorhizobium petrolearium]WGI71432.1 hypothetical protein QEO92_29270 [Neorhizobium petrolearium]